MSAQQTMLDKYATCKDLSAYDGKKHAKFYQHQFVKMIRYFVAR